MPLCESRLQGQRFMELDRHYSTHSGNSVQNTSQQGDQPSLYEGLPSEKSVHKWDSQPWATFVLVMVFDGTFLCCSPVCCLCGTLSIPALEFIAESVSMLLRVLVHPPFTQITLLRLQRFLTLGTLGMKPSLRYWSDHETLKMDFIAPVYTFSKRNDPIS